MQIPSTGANPYAVPPTSAAGPTTPTSGAGGDSGASNAVQDFLDYVGQTPAEQMRSEILHELGVSEDDMKNMSPADRAKLEQKIKELTKEKVQESTEKKTGVIMDIKV